MPFHPPGRRPPSAAAAATRATPPRPPPRFVVCAASTLRRQHAQSCVAGVTFVLVPTEAASVPVLDAIAAEFTAFDAATRAAAGGDSLRVPRRTVRSLSLPSDWFDSQAQSQPRQ